MLFSFSFFKCYRKYPEGWTTDKDRDTTLEYRLSIYHAVQDDSGVFTCITPTRHTHSVEIVVKGNTIGLKHNYAIGKTHM